MAATCKARESWDSALWKGLVFFAKQLHNLVIQLQGISFPVRCKSNQGKQHRLTAQDNITNNISKNRHTTHCLQTKRHALERTKTKTRSVAPSWIYSDMQNFSLFSVMNNWFDQKCLRCNFCRPLYNPIFDAAICLFPYRADSCFSGNHRCLTVWLSCLIWTMDEWPDFTFLAKHRSLATFSKW